MINKFLILILMIAAGVILFFTDGKNIQKAEWGTAPDSLTNDTLQLERERWSKIVDEVGVDTAYTEFKRQYKDKSFSTQHLAAHIFGALLYRKAGITGQAVCDSTFSFGCYHSFFSAVLSDKGPNMIAALNQACLDKFGSFGTGCQHGIGHSVMEYFGPRRLTEALNACASTTQTVPTAGCSSGVFMEYHFPVLVDGDNATSTRLPLNKNNPYEPCPAVPQNFKTACYYSLGQWWKHADNYRDDWNSIGVLCKNIADSSHKESCYLGVGHVIASEGGFDPITTLEACRKMPDQKFQITCRAGAHWGFTAVEQHNLAVDMCGGLEKADIKECLRMADTLNPSKK